MTLCGQAALELSRIGSNFGTEVRFAAIVAKPPRPPGWTIPAEISNEWVKPSRSKNGQTPRVYSLVGLSDVAAENICSCSLAHISMF